MSTPPVTVDDALRQAQATGLDRQEARTLLAAAVAQTRAWLIAHGDVALDANAQARWADWLARHTDGEPLAYLLGEQEFHGLPLVVAPGVLIPRPDTETLVDWALELIPGLPAPGQPAIADLGTGSGAIALALKHARPGAQVCATDLSPAALAVARANGARLGLSIDWLEGAWWEPLAGRRFDVVATNPPYIAEGDPHLPALRHEPTLALTSGPDGLDAIRAIVTGAQMQLNPQGWLLIEHGYDQHLAVQELMISHGFRQVSSRFDLAGHPRCTGGQRP